MTTNLITQRRISNKYNDSGLRMFKLLTLLFQGEASFKDVIKIFVDCEKSNSCNANVILCKYLNSLKVFGIRVEKIKHKYHAYNLPYAYNFTREELEAIQKIKNCSELVLNENVKKQFDKFMSALEIRFDDETQQIATEIDSEDEFDFSFFFKDMKDKIEECEKYIEDNQILDVVYIDKTTEEKRIFGKPLELNYDKRNASLRIYNSKDSAIYDISINSIRSITQTPQKSGMPVAPAAPVVFKLSGRLAQNYKLRPNEYSKGIDAFDGRLVVVNRNEDISELLHRLMRYGTNCEVTNPKNIRNQMEELLDKTLANYS